MPEPDPSSIVRTVCEGPLGAVRLLERPSWFTAEPQTAAKGLCAMPGSSSLAAHSTMAAKPSPRP